jgi:hypothetical protein
MMEHPGVGTLHRLGEIEVTPVLDRGTSRQDSHRKGAKEGSMEVGEKSHPGEEDQSKSFGLSKKLPRVSFFATIHHDASRLLCP